MKHQLPLVLLAVLAFAMGSGCKRKTELESSLRTAKDANAAAEIESYQIGSIPNVHALAGSIYLAGQPTPEDFQLAKKDGIKTIINLRPLEELKDFDEETLAKAAGLNYVHLPWNGVDQLTDEVFQRSRELFETAERPMLMHCGSANRVGALWIPWRVLDEKISFEDALAEAKAIGLKTAGYETKARSYIDQNRSKN